MISFPLKEGDYKFGDYSPAVNDSPQSDTAVKAFHYYALSYILYFLTPPSCQITAVCSKSSTPIRRFQPNYSHTPCAWFSWNPASSFPKVIGSVASFCWETRFPWRRFWRQYHLATQCKMTDSRWIATLSHVLRDPLNSTSPQSHSTAQSDYYSTSQTLTHTPGSNYSA